MEAVPGAVLVGFGWLTGSGRYDWQTDVTFFDF